MPRLFIGLELPEMVRTRLGLLRGPLPGAKWIETENMHITLRFAGDIDNREADELVGFLDGIEAAPFQIMIREMGAFGGRDPRAIYAGIERNPELEHLQRAVERACRSAGLVAEPRAFKPHVTLARLRGTKADVVARFLGSRGSIAIGPITIDQFALFSSRPNVGGGPYVVENVFPFY
ncbi:MAG: RNA 2',3'-cyclic phosphodiesterase [Hyphomicrobiaceae bacterium]